VSQTRNYAFHHVLPFDATVEINLLSSDVRAEKIRLFLPFGEMQSFHQHVRQCPVIDKDFSTIMNRNSRGLAEKLVMGGFVCILETPPTTYIVDQNRSISGVATQ
jgi:hypothetical protein